MCYNILFVCIIRVQDVFTRNDCQVSRDPRWGRCYESYSEDTEVVRKMTCLVEGLQGKPPTGYPKGYPFVAGRYREKFIHISFSCFIDSTYYDNNN